MPDSGTDFPAEAGTELVRTLEQRVSLAATLSNKDITLARASATYILYKRKRLTPATERGYRAALDDFTAAHPNARVRGYGVERFPFLPRGVDG